MENCNEYVTRSHSRSKSTRNEFNFSKNENTKIDSKAIDVYWILKNLPADICLVANGKCFRAHKLILENYCDNLDKLLKPHGEFIYLNSSQYAVIYLLLHVYMPPLKITICNINDAIDIANELGCVDLKLKCRGLVKKVIKKNTKIRKKLSEEPNSINKSLQQQVRYIFKLTLFLVNICEKASFMNEYNELLKIVKSNREVLFENNDFEKYFLNLNKNVLKTLLDTSFKCSEEKNQDQNKKSDTSNLDLDDENSLTKSLDSKVNGFSVFLKIYKWILHDKFNREKYAEELFQLVNYDIININDIIEIEKNYFYFLKNSPTLCNALYDTIKKQALNEPKKDARSVMHKVSSTKKRNENNNNNACGYMKYERNYGEQDVAAYYENESFIEREKNCSHRDIYLNRFPSVLIVSESNCNGSMTTHNKIMKNIKNALYLIGECRNRYVCIYFENCIRIIGGTIKTPREIFPNHDWEFNIEKMSLKKIARIPGGRVNFGVCTVNSTYILVAGGKNSKNEINCTIEYCNIQDESTNWYLITRLEYPCLSPAIKMYQKKIFIVGGLIINEQTKRLQISSQVYCFDIETEQMKLKRSIDRARFNAFLIVYKERLYLVAGVASCNPDKITNNDQFRLVTTVERYNKGSDAWIKVSELANLKKNSSFQLTKDGIIYVVEDENMSEAYMFFDFETESLKRL